jgi:hypothetical protein
MHDLFVWLALAFVGCFGASLVLVILFAINTR